MLSVIVPVYNVEDYITQCVESILIQTYKDYECILVDDGSTDRSGKICDELAMKNNQVTVIHKSNGGLSDARNCGIDYSSGKYILFIDSDDFYTEDICFETLVGHAEKNRLDITCFNYARYSNRRHILGNKAICYNKENVNSLEEIVFNNAYQSSACIKMITLQLIKENDLYFEVNRLSEDIEWSAKLLLYTECVGFIDNVYYAYRIRERSISQTISLKTVLHQLEIFQRMYQIDVSKKKYYIKHYIAFQYCTLLINASLCRKPVDKSIWIEIKQYKDILKYHSIKEVRLIYLIEKALGFRLMTILLSKYYVYTMKNK